MTEEEKKSEIEMHKDPANWKLGVFYYNPKDKRVFLPKRNQTTADIGGTINFARPLSYLMFLPAVLIPVLIILVYTFKD